MVAFDEGTNVHLTQTPELTRRRVVGGVAGVAGLAAVATMPADRAVASVRPSSSGYPFRLGIASGDPRPDGVVLWTRLAPEPFEHGGGMPDVTVGVDWIVAKGRAMRRTVRGVIRDESN